MVAQPPVLARVAGLSGRMKTHQQAISRVRSGRRQDHLTRLYEFAAQYGVISEFFVVAQCAPTHVNKNTAFLIEGLIQVHLNLIPDIRSRYHSLDVAKFLEQTRAAISSKLPDFSSIGLNSATVHGA